MSNINQRIESLELPNTARAGIAVVYFTRSRPGVFWRAADNKSGSVPEDVKTFGQDQVDELSKTRHVIIVEYVAME